MTRPDLVKCVPDEFVIEVWRKTVGSDPSIFIFHAKVVSSNGDEWNETLATVGILAAYLSGWRAALSMTGYDATMLSWSIPSTWDEPSGKRWKVSRQSSCTVTELRTPDSDKNAEVNAAN